MTAKVLVTRAVGQAEALESALRERGLEPVVVPAIAVEMDPPGGGLDRTAGILHNFSWAVVTSPNGARAILASAKRVGASMGTPRWAAIGDGTAAILEGEGVHVDLRPSRAQASVLAEELPLAPGDAVLLLRGDLSGEELPARLRDRGAKVEDVVAYRTIEGPTSSRLILREAFASGEPDAVLLVSGSAARGLLSLAEAESVDVIGVPAVCIGPETRRESARLGFRILATSPEPNPWTFAATTAEALMALAQPLETR